MNEQLQQYELELKNLFSKNTPPIEFVRFNEEFKYQHTLVHYVQNDVEYTSSIKKIKSYIKNNEFQYKRIRNKVDLNYIQKITLQYCVKTRSSIVHVGTFNKRDTLVTLTCRNEHTVERKFQSINLNNACPSCIGPQSLSFDDIIKNVKSRCDELNYTFGGFIRENGARSVLNLQCSRNHQYEPLYYNFINSKYKCGSCALYDKSSYKCTEILNFLQEMNLVVHCEYKFEQCRNTNVLPFDFYIPSLNLCIEYDGEQHYNPIDFWGGIEALAKQQENDTIKSIFCEQNGIHLIRIKYNIENYIDVVSEFIKGIKHE